MEAAKELTGSGIDAEVVNLRSLRPLDIDTVCTSLAKTHHLVTVEQGWPIAGIGSEVSARVCESEFKHNYTAFFNIYSI